MGGEALVFILNGITGFVIKPKDLPPIDCAARAVVSVA